jgi:hypothetical protein
MADAPVQQFYTIPISALSMGRAHAVTGRPDSETADELGVATENSQPALWARSIKSGFC